MIFQLFYKVSLTVLMSCHLASGAGGPTQRHSEIPTSAKLAVLRSKFLQAQHGNQRENLLSPHVREGRNLANVFPFVGGNRGLPRARLFGEEPLDIHHDHHDHHHEAHHEHHHDVDPRISR